MNSKPAIYSMLVIAILFISLEAQAQSKKAPVTPVLEKEYEEHLGNIQEDDPDAQLELAGWCHARGFIREMLQCLDRVVTSDPERKEARMMLQQIKEDGNWIYHAGASSIPKNPVEVSRAAASRQEKFLRKSKSSVFKMAKKAARFNFWTDLDKDLLQDYIQVLNPFYDETRGFFRLTRTEFGIDACIFSRRSDYLNFYSNRSGKSGEHIAGFFSYNDEHSLLCFYDNPYNRESVFNTARHECTHLMVKNCLFGGHLGHWLNEGVACYCAAAGDARTGSHPATCALTVRHALESNTVLSLADLMVLPYKDYTFDHYALAWSWVYYLRNKPETRDKLSKVFIELRKLAMSKVSEEWDLAQWEEVTNTEFIQALGQPEKLQQGWYGFVREKLVPETPEQKFHFADILFDMADGWRTMKPEGDSEKKRAWAREGETLMAEALVSEDAGVRAKAKLGMIEALITRALSFKYNSREAIYVASEVASKTGHFLLAPEHVDHFSDAAGLIFSTLVLIWNTGGYEYEKGVPCDFPALIDAREKSYLDAGKEEMIPMLRFQKQVVEKLISLSRYACRQSLAGDPAQNLSALRWLKTAMEFYPADLEQLLPSLLLQLSLDPHNLNMAAVAAAYAGLGKHGYARSMMDRAIMISPDKDSLDWYAAFIKKEDK